MPGGFADLRIGGTRGLGDASVWPSFTDIMTVIVMVFLMALAVIMVRNIELDRQLVASISARDASQRENQGLAAQVRALEIQLRAGEARATQQAELEQHLRGQLAALAARFAALELRTDTELKNARTQNVSLADQLRAANLQLEEIALLLRAAQQQREALQAQLETQTAAVQTKQDLVDKLLQNQRQSVTRYKTARAEIAALTALIAQRQTEIAALRKLAETSDGNFRSLQEEYDSLEEEYRSLVRPARSPVGKYVAEIWIEKRGAAHQFRLKLPNETTPRALRQAQLHKRLRAMKAAHGDNLYTKVVIPEDSNLSHNEAWELTQDILRRFDYYYQ